MKPIFPAIALAVLAAVSLSGCKLVFHDDTENGTAASTGEQSDDARIASLIDETFERQLVPYITENAVEASELIDALHGGLDTAGEEMGYRATGQGAWNFAVRGRGTVVENKLDTRARVLGVDVDGNGSADVSVQLGPVVRGTALRDVAPFYDFNDFRDQIVFAKLARGINDRISANIMLDQDDYVGRTVRFAGAAAVSDAEDEVLVAPIDIEVSP